MADEDLQNLSRKLNIYCCCPKCGRLIGRISMGSDLLEVCKCSTEVIFYSDPHMGRLTVFFKPKEKTAS